MSVENPTSSFVKSYDAFGQRVRSFLPLLAPEIDPGEGPIDWDFRLGDTDPSQLSTGPCQELKPLSAGRYTSHGFAEVSFDGPVVRLHPSPSSLLDDLPSLMTGALSALLLGRAAHLVIHGTTLRFGDQLVVICGHAGAGKSTTAAFLAQQGCMVHADDVAPIRWIDGVPVMYPGFAGIRLFPQSLELLGLDTNTYPQVHSQTAKRLVSIGPIRSDRGKPLPVAAIVLLEEAPGFEAKLLSEREAIVTLLNMQHPTASQAVDATNAGRITVFGQATQLARQTRVIHLCREKTYQNLIRCHEFLREALMQT